ncbi:hypothetical protein DFH07DRAFT_863726 [Mycena maculata]|uniref:RNA polymerase I-specific transcription initiation factor rrn7 n=1 Tax=Mycena maculata TaxID=230809 RepID=A0AAD7H6R7_9AGAR|nr:hypothetical protein DFH07DRAFT_863726 [Mycena maculata]
MAPRKRCPVCRSKTWHKEPSSGLIACSEGHILQNYRNETTEVDDLGAHHVKKRNLKSTRENKARTSGDSQLYHGNRGRYFYFQCLQLILRHQIAVLIDRWGLPAELEVVCRDLWALHLSLLRSPPPPEPYLAAQEQDGAPPDSNEAKVDSNSDDEVPPSSDDEDPDQKDEDEEKTDAELEELLAENSASSSSDAEDEEAGESKPKPQPKRPGWHEHDRTRARATSTLAVLVVACWTLRFPILYRDLTRLIESYDLPFLDAARLLPRSMTVHLTKQNIQALSPAKTPSAETLHRLSSSLARRIYASFGVRTPEANAAPILWRVVSQGLGGSPTLYRLTKRLATVLALPLTLHASLAPRLEKRRTRNPETHRDDSVAPEVAFLATSIIVLKMVYGMDGEARHPTDSEDAACEMPRLDEYLARLGGLADGDAVFAFDSRTEMAIEDLGDDTVDEYIAFCERALLGGPVNEQDVLDRYFPIKTSQATRKPVVNEGPVEPLWGLGATGLKEHAEEVHRPGENYTVWAPEEMPDSYGMVVKRASRWAAVGEEYVSTVVAHYERRLSRWWIRSRRDFASDFVEE